MSKEPQDSLFKLRLPGQLREKLEYEAQSHGKTLTAEILERLELTFSDTLGRIEKLEALVLDKNHGIGALNERVGEADNRLEDIECSVEDLNLNVFGGRNGM